MFRAVGVLARRPAVRLWRRMVALKQEQCDRQKQQGDQGADDLDDKVGPEFHNQSRPAGCCDPGGAFSQNGPRVTTYSVVAAVSAPLGPSR